MSRIYRLFWLRETGCDAGTPRRADELEPAIQQPVLRLAGNGHEEIAVRLPYLSLRDWGKRGEILAALQLERQGNVISAMMSPGMALRDTVAHLVLTDPAWIDAPATNDPGWFPMWQNISMKLQRTFRESISEEYFRDIANFTDREAAYTMIVYRAARVCRGRPRAEFTYGLHDYPECRNTVAVALKMTGVRTQVILEEIEARLQAAGMTDLARRYAPLWYQDLAVGVRRRPRAFIALLRAESAFIDAIVELSLDRTHSGVHRFSRTANQALRKVYGMDMRHLGESALGQVTKQLATYLALGGGAMVEENDGFVDESPRDQRLRPGMEAPV